MPTRPLTQADWQQINPEFADLLKHDREFLRLVDLMLDSKNDALDLLLVQARLALQQMVNIVVEDDILAYEIDAAVLFLKGSPEVAQRYLAIGDIDRKVA
jgi:hypothetical protein